VTSPVVIVDPAVQELHARARSVARGDISVLIVGETGSGKEILAEMIHAGSLRADKPLLRLNCAAVSETLLESELFGHERGAFTGADQAKIGLLESADGGTVLFDEVGEMSPAVQAKLLRVIDERAIMRIGSCRARPIDVRFVSATNRDLLGESQRGTFRSDLYFRLGGVTLVVPPLRARPTEIEPLALAFLERTAHEAGRSPPRLSSSALRWLRDYHWPGNVRELRNMMEHAVLVCDGGEIVAEHLAFQLADGQLPSNGDAVSVSSQSEVEGETNQERERIVEALRCSGGNQTRAARLLGISRSRMLALLNEYRLPRPRRRPLRLIT
jgi:two-component system, NtrC family, response regulator AtoC